MSNIVGFERKKKMYHRFTLQIDYTDETSEEVVCTFFGTSVDNPDFMMFSNAHPDDEDEIAQVPDMLLNTQKVKTIRVLKIDGIEE